MRQLSWIVMALALLVVMFALILAALKWKSLIPTTIPVTLVDLGSAYWSADFIGLFGLGFVGAEAYKVIRFRCARDVWMMSLADRLLSVVWAILFCAAAAATYFLSFPAIACIVLYGVLVFFTAGILRVRPAFVVALPIGPFRPFIRSGSGIPYRQLVKHGLLTGLSFCNLILMHYFLFMSLGLSLPVIQLCIFVPLLGIATALPISFQGIGTRELLFVQFARLTFQDPSVFLAVSAVSYLLLLSYAVAGLIPFIMARKPWKLSFHS